MSEIYGKESGGQIVETRIVGEPYPNRPPLIVNEKKTPTPNTAQQFIDAGWLLRIIPIPLATQKLGALVFNIDNYTWALDDKSPEELQAEIDEQAEAEELENEITASPLDSITFAQVDNYVDNNSTDLASANEILKKWGKAILINNKKIST